MNKINRNERCRCGSGRKYKHCCGAPKPFTPKPQSLEGLVPGVRMKGGVRSNPAGDGFIAIVHVWDNIECRGEPHEWQSPPIFPSDDEAMEHYKRDIRPSLELLMGELAQRKGGKSFHRRLE